MSTRYVSKLVELLDLLEIPVPTNIRTDQNLSIDMMGKIKVAVDAVLEDVATGNAVVADVIASKTFSTAAGVGLVGTLTLAGLTADSNAVATDIADAKTAYVNGVKLVGTLTLAGLTADSDAVEGDIRAGKTAYVNGIKITGTALIS